MIPQSQLQILEDYKSYSYNRVNELYQNWKKGNPRKGCEAISDDGSIDGRDFYNAWINESENKKLAMGWDENTYFQNFINGSGNTYPQQKGVVEHYKQELNLKWKQVDEVLASKYGADFSINSVSINDMGKVDYSFVSGKIKNIKGFELNKIKNKDEKQALTNVLDTMSENIKICKEIVKENDTYWKNWDQYLTTWKNDVDEYDKKWQQLLEDIKNGETQEQSEEVIPEEPKNDLPSNEQNEKPEEKSNNVMSSADENTYQNISNTDSAQDTSTTIEHTRIYEYFASTIQLDEMSIPIIDNIDSNSTIDPSTKQHIDASNNINSNPYETKGNLSPSKTMAIGFMYPLLRINDHYYGENDIKYFSMETIGFIPTIEVTLECTYNDILKSNMIKDGDKCSVYINPGHGTIKSYRGDFQITNVKTTNLDQFKIQNSIKIKFIGELFIPSLYDSTQTFAFSGSSRDALIDIAQKLGLGFFFSDPENTNDIQMWYSMADGEQKSFSRKTSPAIEYIQNTSKHAYKNFESFYDCWIDPRYAISFINIAQMLGGAGLDEEIDLAVFNSAQAIGRGKDANNRELSDEEKAKNPQPQAKILMNFGQDEDAITSFLVTSYSEQNDGNITNKLGLSNANYYNIKNSGITRVEDNSIEMNLSIPVNADKLKNGFYIMAGPGQNLTYTEGDNGSFVDQHVSVQGGKIVETQSDEDSKDIIDSGNNMLASGNTNKFYETAEGHNLLCNSWLKKKTIHVVLNGCNLQIMRGEKIPMMLKDNFNQMINYMQANSDEQMAYQQIVISGTGWFIIKNIKWIYNREKIEHGTPWKTELTLTRREWPIPGYNKNTANQNGEIEQNANTLYVENNLVTGTTKEAINNLSEETQQQEEQPETELSLAGVNQYLVQIYDDIKSACSAGGAKIVLVSGKRTPVNENGNETNAQGQAQDGTLWKFKNANGDIVWYSSQTSPHVTGDAIDIINGEGTTFEQIAQYILSDQKTLYDMITNGVYLGQEVSKDDIGTTIKHYHIGKPDKSNSETVTAQRNWWEKLVYTYNKSIVYNGSEIQVLQWQKYSNK